VKPSKSLSVSKQSTKVEKKSAKKDSPKPKDVKKLLGSKRSASSLKVMKKSESKKSKK
jgi:hypothetical protein